MVVFVSYSSQDKGAIEPLRNALRRAHHQVWMDEELGGGEAWWRTILEQIRSCEVFVVALSNNSLGSKPCQAELRYAQALRRPILPVQIGPVTNVRLNPLAETQMIDFRNPTADAGIQLIGALQAQRAQLQPLPPELPDEPPVPFAYLMRLAHNIAEPQLSARQQADLVSELKSGLEEDGEDPAARSDIRQLLCMLRDRPDVAWRVRTDTETLLASIHGPAADAAPTTGPMPTEASAASSGPLASPAPPRTYAPPQKTKRGKQRGLKDEKKKGPKSQPSRDRHVVAGDRVSSSVFAPPAVKGGDAFLVQVFAHLPEHATQVETLAQNYDSAARPRASFGLDSRVRRDDRLSFELRLPGLIVDDPVESLVWTGQPASVQFDVAVPMGFSPTTVIGAVTVSRASVPLGHVKFKVDICEPEALRGRDVKPERGDLHRYSRAFISYASADLKEVLKRTQMLAGVGIDFFQELLSLEPGQRWERQLYREIDKCDVFFLFWSSAAKKSEWVLKEVQYAMQRNGGDELAPPEILPVIIEGPPPVTPPPELAHLHMNDRMIYYMQTGQSNWLSRLRRRGS